MTLCAPRKDADSTRRETERADRRRGSSETRPDVRRPLPPGGTRAALARGALARLWGAIPTPSPVYNFVTERDSVGLQLLVKGTFAGQASNHLSTVDFGPGSTPAKPAARH